MQMLLFKYPNRFCGMETYQETKVIAKVRLEVDGDII
jgi:hypothetical protein